jgi:hypothetical protein
MEKFARMIGLMDGIKQYDIDPLFENGFGLIINNKLFTYSFYKKGGINIDNIKRISVIKKRKKNWNIISFSITFILLVFLVLSNYNSLILKIITFCTALIFIIIAFKIKKYEYTLLLISGNLDFNEILIDKEMKEDAKELVFYINQIIKGKAKIN